jgi:hypothetical protein
VRKATTICSGEWAVSSSWLTCGFRNLGRDPGGSYRVEERGEPTVGFKGSARNWRAWGGRGRDSRRDGRTTWTLGAIKQRNLALEGYCQTGGCGHFYAFNVDDLIASAGPDYVVPEILPSIVCRECGGDLKFKLAMMPPEG